MKNRTFPMVCTAFVLFWMLNLHTTAAVFSLEGIIEPVYLEIADYYDNRQAVVTVTADDWSHATWSKFEAMGTMLSDKRVYYTGAIITDGANWTQIQHWLDQGYAEAASHSRSHPSTVPYSD
jgi:hypothetical protein